MAVRAGMAALIGRLRSAIGDTSTPPVFTDQELQDLLDERRTDVSAVPLAADQVLSGSPLIYRAPIGYWETGAVVANGSAAALNPNGADTDPVAGVWHFTSAPSGGVYVTGRYFDFWGTASSALEAWAARVATQFDFATDNQRFNRSQKREGLLAVAREYARRASPPRGRVGWGASTSTWSS